MKFSRSKQFKKDLRNYTLKMSDKHFDALIDALAALSKGDSLPEQYRDHALKGRLANYREFHLGGDLLVLYSVENDIIYLIRLGTHADILGM